MTENAVLQGTGNVVYDFPPISGAPECVPTGTLNARSSPRYGDGIHAIASGHWSCESVFEICLKSSLQVGFFSLMQFCTIDKGGVDIGRSFFCSDFSLLNTYAFP
jgi:hypothetical protein